MSVSTETASDHYEVGIDIGGTFTDCVIVADDGAVTLAKSPSTPDDFSTGFFRALEVGAEVLGLDLASLLRRTSKLAHGTTVGINAVVSRTGAHVGLLATKGHSDSLRILNNTGRTNGMPIEKVLNYAASSLPERFVARRDVVEITERVDCFGAVIVKLDLDNVARESERLLAQGVDAIAVSYLWSHLNPQHEEATVAFLAERYPELYVSAGARLAQKIGEYPRTATCVLNSYIGPLMRGYVTRLVEGLSTRGYGGRLLFAQCDTGLVDATEVIERPILTLASGPAGGVLACVKSGGDVGETKIIAADMGGTTFDVSVISGGELPIRRGVVVEQHDLYLRMVDVESVGAGGGSIAWIDPTSGALRVGPRSAGAVPGPACYRRGGTEATVTDADLVVGLLNPHNFLGGQMKLDVKAACCAIKPLAERLQVSVLECAAGIQTVADNLMEDKIRSMTVSRGYDPREFTLYAFGGGGGVHAGWFSQGLGIKRVIIPVGDLASGWSAFGISLESYARSFEAPMFMPLPLDIDQIVTAFDRLGRDARAAVERSGLDWKVMNVSRTADLRYSLQVFDLEARFPEGEIDECCLEGLLQNFERTYETRYGADAGYREGGIELTALRLVVEAAETGRRQRKRIESRYLADGTLEPLNARGVYWYESRAVVPTPVFDGFSLRPGMSLAGPALIDFPDTTVVVRPGLSIEMMSSGNLSIEASDH